MTGFFRFTKMFCQPAFMLIVTGCRDDKAFVSPYDHILKQPQFAALTDSIRKDPNNDELLFRRAVLLNNHNYPEPALADLTKAWSLKKQEKYALGISAILLHKKPDSAILFLDEALKKLPASIPLQLNQARAYAASGNTEQALRICDALLVKNPLHVDGITLKADLLDIQGKREEATAMLELAYRITPFNTELCYMLALRYAEAKNPKVLALCDSLIKADENDSHAEPYYYKGIYFSNINDKQKALALFDETIRRDYNFLEGYIEKGSILFEMKKYNKALDVFNLAMTISPNFADAYYWIAKCQEAIGKREDAKLNYLRAYELDKALTEAKEAAGKIK